MTFDPRENASDADVARANDPSVGTGTPETAPWEDVEPPSWLRRQPLVALLAAILAADLSALVAELAAGSTDPVVVALLGTLGTILAVGGRLAWLAVTPIAAPRLDRETPLGVVPDLSD